MARTCRRTWGTTATTNVAAATAADTATAADVTATTHIAAATHASTTAYVAAIINASSATHMTATTAGDTTANRMRRGSSAAMETWVGCRRAIDISTRIGGTAPRPRTRITAAWRI